MTHLGVSHPAIDQNHPVYDGVLVADGQVRMFDEPTFVVRSPMAHDEDGVSGELFGTTDEAEPRGWITSWRGGGSRFSHGAAGRPHDRRTLFLWRANPAKGHDTFTADGQQLLLNVAAHTRRKPRRILMLVSAGHSREESVRAMGNWIQSQQPVATRSIIPPINRRMSWRAPSQRPFDLDRLSERHLLEKCPSRFAGGQTKRLSFSATEDALFRTATTRPRNTWRCAAVPAFSKDNL